jgi:ethanolamine utilization protein EutN
MRLGRVCGNVVATVKADGLSSYKLLLVREVDPRDPLGGDGDASAAVYAAVDLVGVGEGEIVLVAHGGAARVDEGTARVPTDAAIVAIVDSARLDSRTTFVK